jgi:phage tail-like protein
VNDLPSYRQYLLLAPQPGWQATAFELSPDASGAYRLDALPGGAAALPTYTGVAPIAPVAVAAETDGPVHVLDAADMRIKVLDIAGKRPGRALPGIGGIGGDARHFRSAQGIALLARGALAVADTGNGYVKIFSAYPYALLAVWGPFGEPARVAAGIGGLLWVLDRAGKRVFSLDQDGATRATLPALVAPLEMATDAAGDIAVLDGANIVVFPPGGGAPAIVGTVANASSLAFGDAGFLYVGTQSGLVYSFAPDDPGWRRVGIGVLGEQAAVSALFWRGGSTLIALVREPGASAAQLWTIDTAAAHVPSGKLITCELDSGINDCVWHRIALDADIPDGTSIEVVTEAYDEPPGSTPPDLVAPPITLSADTLEPGDRRHRRLDRARDCLVQGGSGQYLKLTLTLRSNGIATPVLRSIRIWFPRDSWLKYLPAPYQEDDQSRSFLSRFLSILQTDFDGFDETVDDIWTLFDPLSVPGKSYAWLAAWLALPIKPTWSDAQRRSVLKSAYTQYKRRGTVVGLQQLISDYAGVGARLVEHYRLRQLIQLADDPAKATATGGGRLWSRDFYRRLQIGVYSQVGYFKLVGEPEPGVEPVAWGVHQFSVFFNAEPLGMDATRKSVAAVVEREKPAHTMATYRPVYARMRLGVQATLGVDTRIGDVGQAVLGRVSTLGYDAILAPSTAERAFRAMGAVQRPRLGIDARLS